MLILLLCSSRKLGFLRKYSRRDYFYSSLLGFLNPFLYYIVLFKAYSMLPAQEAQALNYTWPLIVVILSIPLLNQRMASHSCNSLHTLTQPESNHPRNYRDDNRIPRCNICCDTWRIRGFMERKTPRSSTSIN